MTSTLSPTPSLPVRRVHAEDERAVARLAQLDSAAPLAGERLVAEREGRPIAAISLVDGRVVADPFVLAGDAVALLRRRYAQTRALWRTPRLRDLRPRRQPTFRPRFAA